MDLKTFVRQLNELVADGPIGWPQSVFGSSLRTEQTWLLSIVIIETEALEQVAERNNALCHLKLLLAQANICRRFHINKLINQENNVKFAKTAKADKWVWSVWATGEKVFRVSIR